MTGPPAGLKQVYFQSRLHPNWSRRNVSQLHLLGILNLLNDELSSPNKQMWQLLVCNCDFNFISENMKKWKMGQKDISLRWILVIPMSAAFNQFEFLLKLHSSSENVILFHLAYLTVPALTHSIKKLPSLRWCDWFLNWEVLFYVTSHWIKDLTFSIAEGIIPRDLYQINTSK